MPKPLKRIDLHVERADSVMLLFAGYFCLRNFEGDLKSKLNSKLALRVAPLDPITVEEVVKDRKSVVNFVVAYSHGGRYRNRSHYSTVIYFHCSGFGPFPR